MQWLLVPLLVFNVLNTKQVDFCYISYCQLGFLKWKCLRMFFWKEQLLITKEACDFCFQFFNYFVCLFYYVFLSLKLEIKFQTKFSLTRGTKQKSWWSSVSWAVYKISFSHPIWCWNLVEVRIEKLCILHAFQKWRNKFLESELAQLQIFHRVVSIFHIIWRELAAVIAYH